MTKIVYNGCFGGFSVSDAAMHRYAVLKGLKLYPEKDARGWFTTYWLVPRDKRIGVLEDEAWHSASEEQRIAANKAYDAQTLSIRDFDRADPVLVQVIEELGDAASGDHANLKIAYVPAGTKYRIDEYDGNESVMTVDDYEWSTA